MKQEFEAYEKKATKEIDELWVKLSKCRRDRDETLEKLKKINEDIVKPLIEQVTNNATESVSLKADNQKLCASLKIAHSILRSPKLCDLYAKQERKIMTDK